jgi:threonine dehydrogenase-like Zn-dependent dehydrogenase
MKAAIFNGKHDIRIETVPDPKILAPTDVIVRVTHACICGSDLWYYRGLNNWEPGWRTGHEFAGIIEEVGPEVHTLRKGNRVLAPFAYSDGSCEYCLDGLPTSCIHGGFWGGADMDGGQGELVRVPYANATLLVMPSEADDDHWTKKLMPLTDVLPTGHHAALSAGVNPGSTVAIIGDGAVGLCAVIAAKRLGAERIYLLGHQLERMKIGRHFGATDLVVSRGAETIAELLETTKGGVHCVVECVGTSNSLTDAVTIARPGGTVGYVGVPHQANAFNFQPMFMKNVSLRGGVAPVRVYIPELLADVLDGKIDPSPVLDMTVSLDGVPAGYAAMDKREATKVLVEIA